MVLPRVDRVKSEDEEKKEDTTRAPPKKIASPTRAVITAYLGRGPRSPLRVRAFKGPFSGKHARYVVYWSPKETRKKERGNFCEIIIQTS